MEQLKEAHDFIEFLASKVENNALLKGIEKLTSESKSFEFLEDEEVEYTKEALKED
jgi:hypothetical protein